VLLGDPGPKDDAGGVGAGLGTGLVWRQLFANGLHRAAQYGFFKGHSLFRQSLMFFFLADMTSTLALLREGLDRRPSADRKRKHSKKDTSSSSSNSSESESDSDDSSAPKKKQKKQLKKKKKAKKSSKSKKTHKHHDRDRDRRA
jgi:hypothetical protein